MAQSFLACLFKSPSERRLRAGWRLVGQTALMYLILGSVGLTASVLLIFVPGIVSSINSTVDNDVLTLFSILASLPAITLSVFLARRFLDRRSFISLGLILNKKSFQDLSLGILLPGLMMGLIFLIEWALGWLHFDGFAWQSQSWSVVIGNTLIMLLVFIAVGWQEELLNRGYYLQNLVDGLNLPCAVLLSSLIFASIHLLNPNFTLTAWVGLILAGLFLAYGYMRTRQLWLPIGLHIGWNFFEGVVFGFPVSGSSFYPLVRQSVEGPSLLTGGTFGPEAGLLCLLVMVFGAFIIYWYTRSKQHVNQNI